jgi:CubicO group peptidase (beta-lactamase class C family)
MKGRFAAALATVACTVAVATGQNLARVDERVDEYVRAEMSRQKIPGLAVAIVRKGEVVKAQGYGEANVEHRVQTTPDTIFQSGSVGKQFTAAGVMLLVEDGKIQLSDPLTKYFADAPSGWKQITVRHLLTHTSGLPDYTGGMVDYRKDYTEDDLLRFAYTLEPEFPPGSRWNYSNTGYVLLGIIVRKVSGEFYGDVLRTRVFQPLGMTTARVINEADIVANRAAGYRLEAGALKNQDWVSPSLNTTADGSLYLSLRDLIAWDKGIRDGRVLKPESWAQVFSPATLTSGRPYPYGFGWSVDPVNTHRAQSHAGSWQGFQTFIVRYPDDDLTIVVLSNLAQSAPGRIAEGISGLLDPTLTRPELKPIAARDPAIDKRVRDILAAAAAGSLKREEFAYVRAGFFPEAPKRYAKLLSGAGPIRDLVLMQATDLGDDRVYVYDVTFASATLRLRLGLAPDGRIAMFDLRPRPEGGR